MTELAAAFAFAGFVLGALWVRMHGTRRAVNVFLAYSLVVSFGAGLTQRDLFPFAAWPLVAGLVPEVITQRRILLVDELGREHEADYRAWYPLSAIELSSWMDAGFLALEPTDKSEVAGYLTDLAESSRLRARQGDVDPFGRFLGPLTAPFFLVSPDRWYGPEAVPSEPFVGIRLYREHWNPAAVHAGRDTIRRELLFDSGSAR